MSPDKQHLVDIIAAVRLPKSERTEDFQVIGDLLSTKSIKKIAKELLKDAN